MRMATQPTTIPVRPRTALVRVVAACVLVFLVLAWAKTVWHARTDRGLLDRDWTMFHRAACLLREGRLGEIYQGSLETRYPFPYPPYVLYLVAPLAAFEGHGAYVALVVGSAVALAASLWIARRFLPGERGDYVTITLVVLSSAAWMSTVVVGQLSAFYLLIIVAGFRMWARGRPFLAGLVLALMAIKPNYGVVFFGVILLQRQWRMAGGCALGLVLLAASTWPMGTGVWTEYLAASRHVTAVLYNGTIPMWKQQTLYAFLSTVVSGGNMRLVLAVWGVCVAGLVATAAAAFRTSVSGERVPRLLAVTALVVVTCNPYAFFYDALLLVLPGIVWYVQRDRYRSLTCHRLAGACLAAVYVWQHLSLFVIKGSIALAGAATTVWLLAEVVEMLGLRRPAARCPLDAPVPRGAQGLR